MGGRVPSHFANAKQKNKAITAQLRERAAATSDYTSARAREVAKGYPTETAHRIAHEEMINKATARRHAQAASHHDANAHKVTAAHQATGTAGTSRSAAAHKAWLTRRAKGKGK